MVDNKLLPKTEMSKTSLEEIVHSFKLGTMIDRLLKSKQCVKMIKKLHCLRLFFKKLNLHFTFP